MTFSYMIFHHLAGHKLRNHQLKMILRDFEAFKIPYLVLMYNMFNESLIDFWINLASQTFKDVLLMESHEYSLTKSLFCRAFFYLAKDFLSLNQYYPLLLLNADRFLAKEIYGI